MLLFGGVTFFLPNWIRIKDFVSKFPWIQIELVKKHAGGTAQSHATVRCLYRRKLITPITGTQWTGICTFRIRNHQRFRYGPFVSVKVTKSFGGSSQLVDSCWITPIYKP